MTRIVCWFSAGAASAVATKLALARYHTHEVVIARCIVPEEHEDNDRFATDCERWFGRPILNLQSSDYASCEEVWAKRRYMAGPGGAPCTIEMKKAVRWAFEREFQPDLQVFGYTAEEAGRASRFRAGNPEVPLVTPLIDEGLTKADCLAMIDRADIEIPAIYRLGFRNANCLGCVKATSPAYWNRIRRHFPEVFGRRAKLSREIGCRLVELHKDRIFLDELSPEVGAGEQEPDMDCSLLCAIAEQKIAEAAHV
ncbi:hypothetical protein [Roseomonas xinghualingensis]|uniref:hypothetical protein n=1 Tax=Roseomonas xinghualingensis TaxID=2986475 RepID=UPI0021F1867C|nr:hypothetical protein [Roseomonas sp. SXEYE001]MCV4210279.1 hypothetical protein [Roseomonas sp. SXEYE001]